MSALLKDLDALAAAECARSWLAKIDRERADELPPDIADHYDEAVFALRTLIQSLKERVDDADTLARLRPPSAEDVRSFRRGEYDKPFPVETCRFWHSSACPMGRGHLCDRKVFHCGAYLPIPLEETLGNVVPIRGDA